MRILAFLMLIVLSGQAAEGSRDGMISVKKFVISAPAAGTYAPWRDPKQNKWFAGEIIVISGSTFRYTTFSDVVGSERDYSGTLSVLKDHIYLEHPGVPYPYRVTGLADGVPVMLTWAGYEQWKEKGKLEELNLLYLQKPAKPKKAQP